MSEYTMVEKRLKQELKQAGWRCYSVEGKNKEDSGIPDVLAYTDKSPTFHFECKLDTELSLQQVLFLKTNKYAYKVKLINNKLMIENIRENILIQLNEFILKVDNTY